MATNKQPDSPRAHTPSASEFATDEAPTVPLVRDHHPEDAGPTLDEFGVEALTFSSRPTRPLPPAPRVPRAPDTPLSTAPPVAGPTPREPAPDESVSIEPPVVRRRARTRWLWASLALISVAVAFALVGVRGWLEPAVARVRARFVPPLAPRAARAVLPPSQPPAAPQRSSAEAATSPSAPAPNADGIVESEVSAPSCETLLGQPDGPALPRGSSAPEALASAREFARQKQFDQAQSVYCRALDEHPEAVAIRVGLLELLLDRRDRLAAARYAGEFAQAFPDDRQLGWLVGDTWAQNGEFARAHTTWLGAMAGGGDEQDARRAARRQLNLARADAQAGRFERAEREYRRAAILDPAGTEAPAGVAGMLLRAGDAPSAVAWARLALGRAPQSATVHLTLGDALQAAGDAAAAEQAWERALKLDPGQRVARERLRALDARRGRGGASGL